MHNLLMNNFALNRSSRKFVTKILKMFFIQLSFAFSFSNVLLVNNVELLVLLANIDKLFLRFTHVPTNIFHQKFEKCGLSLKID